MLQARASPAPESARNRILEANLQAILIHQGELNHMMRTLFMRKASILHALTGRAVPGQAEVSCVSESQQLTGGIAEQHHRTLGQEGASQSGSVGLQLFLPRLIRETCGLLWGL